LAEIDPRLSSELLVPSAEELYEEAPCGYLATLPDGTIVRANRTFLDWTGHERGQLYGTLFQAHLTVAGKIYYETHFAPLLRMQGAIREIALDIVCANGERLPALVNTAQRCDEAGRPLINFVTVFNAADRRRYEQELLAARNSAREAAEELARLNAELEQRVSAAVEERLKLEDALRQAQKMEAIGQLTGGVAHDFNNLLTVILGGLDIIGRQLPSMAAGTATERVRRARDGAMDAANRAARLTQHLLAFARRQPLEPKVIDINKLVSGTSELLRRTLGGQIDLETVLAGGLWAAEVDPVQLENALVNLAVNARDAMPEGGKLTIETHNAHLDDAYVAAIPEGVPAGQYVLIAVSDTGTGMDAETVNRVFEPFFTTKEPGKGTGLGLSQVYGFVRQSGGHVRIYSEPGNGTAVKIYLPRSRGAEEKVERTSERNLSELRGDETILVVEDHSGLRDYVSAILADQGYRILAAETAADALDMLAGESDVRLLLTDVVLPGGMNGRQLADEALQLRPDLKLLFMTGYTRNAIVHGGRLDPGVELIGKPFTYEQLALKLRSLLDR